MSKRGANYTVEEKQKLMDLVKQYPIIEDKTTGGFILLKKKEAWDKISNAYNSVATSGLRSVEKLKVLYDNMKQKTRKALAERNKNEYLTRLIKAGLTEKEFHDAKQKEKDNKIEVFKTGGGSFVPTLTDSEIKILEIVKDQVEPLPNPYDSAAFYFNDVSETAMTPRTIIVNTVQDVNNTVMTPKTIIVDTIPDNAPDTIGVLTKPATPKREIKVLTAKRKLKLKGNLKNTGKFLHYYGPFHFILYTTTRTNLAACFYQSY